jgi:hypothetical protein
VCVSPKIEPGTMTRIIFSRKGFDNSFGGAEPDRARDARLLPIPTRQRTPLTFADLRPPIPELVQHLTRGKLGPERPCHLDPDFDAAAVAHRPPGWRGALGQVAAARAHLANQHVGSGDLFLFWGLFRPVDRVDGRWRYVGRPVHAIFGWLQVADVRENPGGGRIPDCPWLDGHPHTQRGWGTGNTIFLARQQLTCGPREGQATVCFEGPSSLPHLRRRPLNVASARMAAHWRERHRDDVSPAATLAAASEPTVRCPGGRSSLPM